jgi:hypothetical protein
MDILMKAINSKYISQDAKIFINAEIKGESSKMRIFDKDKE